MWKKKKNAAARLAIISATRCTGNRLFFMDGPMMVQLSCAEERDVGNGFLTPFTWLPQAGPFKMP